MAKILSLADGSMTLLPRGPLAGESREVPLASFFPGARRRPGGGVARRIEPGRAASPLSPEYLTALGDSLERLASMALARKLRSPAPIDAAEAAQMVGLAGVPNTRGGQMLTEQILSASADELGKGGVIGSITHTISHVATQVVRPVSKIVAAAAPILDKVPVIGPALSGVVQVTANAAGAIAGGNLKSLTSGGVMGLTQKIAGWAGAGAGAAVGLVGDVAQGIVEAPGTIGSDLMAAGQWAGGEASNIAHDIGGYLGGSSGSAGFFNTLIQGGRSLINSFDSSVGASIERVNPALSGELTSIFHGLGSEYASFRTAFDSWSEQMKASPAGTAAVGSLNGSLYSIVKGLDGRMEVTKTPMQNAPASASSLPQGQLIPASQLSGYGVSVSPMGSGYGPGFQGPVRGRDINPAGISLPGGPINPADDPTSLRILAQAANQANAGKGGPLSLLSSGYSTPLIAAAGLAILYLTLGRGGGLGPDYSYAPPRRLARRRR